MPLVECQPPITGGVIRLWGQGKQVARLCFHSWPRRTEDPIRSPVVKELLISFFPWLLTIQLGGGGLVENQFPDHSRCQMLTISREITGVGFLFRCRDDRTKSWPGFGTDGGHEGNTILSIILNVGRGFYRITGRQGRGQLHNLAACAHLGHDVASHQKELHSFSSTGSAQRFRLSSCK